MHGQGYQSEMKAKLIGSNAEKIMNRNNARAFN
jgi:hypothetical protein